VEDRVEVAFVDGEVVDSVGEEEEAEDVEEGLDVTEMTGDKHWVYLDLL